MAISKAAIRGEVVSQRKALPTEENYARSTVIGKSFVRTLARYAKNLQGLKIGLYRALPFEVDLTELIVFFELKGAHLYFPKVSDPTAKTMDFVQVSPSEETIEWKKGALGIEEPCSILPVAEANSLDIVIVPGIAFGTAFERVGMGAGYYDRYFSAAPKALRIALVFDFQVYDQIEQATWDQKMDWIFGENLDIKGPRTLEWLNKSS